MDLMKPFVEALAIEFKSLGLGPSEARVLVALLREGSATGAQIAEYTDLPRTNSYPLLKTLEAKGLATRIPGDGPVRWMPAPYEAVLDNLEAALVTSQQDELRQHRERSNHLRERLAETMSRGTTVPKLSLRIENGTVRSRKEYEGLLREARTEVLLFSWPRSQLPNATDEGLLAVLKRGIGVRVLTHAGAEPLTSDVRQAYLDAGLQLRVSAVRVPSMVIVDARMAMTSLDDPNDHDAPKKAVVFDHPEYAALQTGAFEHLWSQAEAAGALLKTRSRSRNRNPGWTSTRP